MRARIVVVKSNPSSEVGFLDFLEDNWQIIVYHSELTVLSYSSGTIATCPVFPIKQAIIGLEEREQLLLDLSHLETHLH